MRIFLPHLSLPSTIITSDDSEAFKAAISPEAPPPMTITLSIYWHSKLLVVFLYSIFQKMHFSFQF